MKSFSRFKGHFSMDISGESIVNRAKTIIKNGYSHPSFSVSDKKERNEVVQAFGLAALLSALGAPAIVHVVQNMNREINRYERFELDALVFYAARILPLSEADIRHDMAAICGARSGATLSASEFRVARVYILSLLCRAQEV